MDSGELCAKKDGPWKMPWWCVDSFSSQRKVSFLHSAFLSLYHHILGAKFCRRSCLGQNTTLRGVTEFHCSGNEAKLISCQHTSRNYDCGNNRYAGVVCGKSQCAQSPHGSHTHCLVQTSLQQNLLLSVSVAEKAPHHHPHSPGHVTTTLTQLYSLKPLPLQPQFHYLLLSCAT